MNELRPNTCDLRPAFLAVGFLSVRYRIKNTEELFDTRNPERLPDALAYPDQS